MSGGGGGGGGGWVRFRRNLMLHSSPFWFHRSHIIDFPCSIGVHYEQGGDIVRFTQEMMTFFAWPYHPREGNGGLANAKPP
jgi:hypothetical protein